MEDSILLTAEEKDALFRRNILRLKYREGELTPETVDAVDAKDRDTIRWIDGVLGERAKLIRAKTAWLSETPLRGLLSEFKRCLHERMAWARREKDLCDYNSSRDAYFAAKGETVFLYNIERNLSQIEIMLNHFRTRHDLAQALETVCDITQEDGEYGGGWSARKYLMNNIPGGHADCDAALPSYDTEERRKAEFDSYVDEIAQELSHSVWEWAKADIKTLRNYDGNETFQSPYALAAKFFHHVRNDDLKLRNFAKNCRRSIIAGLLLQPDNRDEAIPMEFIHPVTGREFLYVRSGFPARPTRIIEGFYIAVSPEPEAVPLEDAANIADKLGGSLASDDTWRLSMNSKGVREKLATLDGAGEWVLPEDESAMILDAGSSNTGKLWVIDDFLSLPQPHDKAFLRLYYPKETIASW